MNINVKNLHFLTIIFVIVLEVESADNCSHLPVEAIYQSQRCYWKTGRVLNFTESHKTCQTVGGMLAEIPDYSADLAVKQNWLGEIGSYWVGIHDIFLENKFVNMFNESITYTNWDVDQPNNLNDVYKTADCVLVTRYGWIDAMCGLQYGAVCSKRITPKTETTKITTTTKMTTAETTSVEKTSSSSTTTQRIYLVFNNETQMTTTVPQYHSTTSTQQITLVSNKDTETTTTVPPSQTTTSSAETTRTAARCLCPCTKMENNTIENETQLRMKIEALKKALIVNKTLLSSSLRRRISAPDSRMSATVIGSTLGVAVIVLLIGLLIASDARHLFNDFQKGICRIRKI